MELDIVPSESLALNLLIPSLFLVVNILQFQYFHSGWIELTKMPRYILSNNVCRLTFYRQRYFFLSPGRTLRAPDQAGSCRNAPEIDGSGSSIPIVNFLDFFL